MRAVERGVVSYPGPRSVGWARDPSGVRQLAGRCSLCPARGGAWSSGNMPDCVVRGPSFESHCGQFVFITTATVIYSLGYGLHTLTAVPIGPLSLSPSVGR